MSCIPVGNKKISWHFLQSNQLPQNQWLGRLVTWLKGEGDSPSAFWAKRFLAIFLAIIGVMFLHQAYTLWNKEVKPLDTKDSVSAKILFQIAENPAVKEKLDDFLLESKDPEKLLTIQGIYTSHQLGGDISYDISILDFNLFGKNDPTEEEVINLFCEVLDMERSQLGINA